MKKKLALFSSLAILLVVIIFIIVKGTSHQFIKVNPAFKEYISAFSSGIISSESSIKIRLTNEYADSSMLYVAVDEKLFSFSPNIKGEAKWTDSRTIEFFPKKKLESNALYTVSFALHKIMDVPDSLKNFEFQFQIIKQAFDVNIGNYKSYSKTDLQWKKLNGIINTSDVEDINKIKKLLKATQNGKELNISWTALSDRKHFNFQVDSILRTDKKEIIVLEWDGEIIGADQKGKEEIEITPLGEFKLVDVKVVQAPDQHIVLQFSDPLKEKQNLKGLIRIGSLENLKYIIFDNQIKVYPPYQQTGIMSVVIHKNVKNILGKSLKARISQEVTFENIKPAVRLVGKGVILPSTGGLLLPFEAVNLRAVDIKVYKIYENNLMQFFQNNDLTGNSELARVGRRIFKKTIMLNTATNAPTDYSNWNRFSIDLSKFIITEPGALYRVTIDFKKEHSVYPCSGDNTSDELISDWEEDDDNFDIDEWNYYSDYYEDDYYYYDYDWQERDNPCDQSYYRRKGVSRNVLASDIGLITKIGNDGSIRIFATDLKTAKPLNAITIELYNFQQQLIEKLMTNTDGIATTTLKNKPFLLIAKNRSQRGYLKLNAGSSLSLSKFDVTGVSVQKGIKGFIYGERGVWRPGDTLFLTFILEDKTKKLPESMPVIFDLYNPKGQVYKHIVNSKSVNGFYTFQVVTDPDAPTGNWRANIKVGGASFTKYLRIETIKPNRLKIKLEFEGDCIKKSENKNGSLEVSWLHGAIAKNLKADVKLTLSATRTKFKNFDDYNFDDPSQPFNSETYTVFDSKVDADGKASINPNINIENSAPGILTAFFKTRVFEESGNFSVNGLSVPFYPYESYVGISTPEGKGWSNMLVTDKTHYIQIANVDVDGKILKNNDVTIDVYKIGWNWWYDRTGNRLANYINSSYNTPMISKELQILNGKAKFPLLIKQPDWGRFFIRITDNTSGHSTGQIIYIDWPYWENRNRGGEEDASLLSFTADKEKYTVGEEVKLNIPSGEDGRALVSIENGTKVIETFWVNTMKEFTEFSFKVTEEMSPNIYVNVTLIQQHAQTKNDLPIRLYGIIPLTVEDPNTHVYPIIETAKVFKPETNTTIKIKEKTGKAMTYTIAVVDDGLLDLTNFKTPDPWNHFYAREALGVKTWDLFDYVMGAFGGQLDRILAIGGDEGGGGDGKGKNRANRFKPMVKFFGPFKLKAGETKAQTFMMPQYVGSVRIMVIAGQDGAYGSAEKTVQVRKPVMVLATLPRVLGPGEEVKLPVSVFAMDKTVKSVNLKLSANSVFTIVGGSTQTVKFDKPGDELVTFNLKVKEQIGVGKVSIVATSGKETAKHNIEIEIRNPNPEVTDVVETIIKPGETWNSSFTPPGMTGTNKGIIELSSIPPIDLEKRLGYLVQYPHGCVEQTTSSVFPQLFLSDLMDLNEENRYRIERNIKAGIWRLQGFQTNSGGFGYWPGDGSPNLWGTNYAMHFLLEAKAKGYNVSQNIIDRLVSFQKKQANSWTYQSQYYHDYYDLQQAYRLYTLALAGSPELGAMNRLREKTNLTLAARWRLAAAYALAGQKTAATKLIYKRSTNIKDYRELSYTYGSATRDRAMIIETLSLMDQPVKAAALIKIVAKDLRADRWMSTQTTAYSLIAISKFVKGDGKAQLIKYDCSINGGSSKDGTTKKSIAQLDMSLKGSAKKGKVRLKNNGSGILYARVILSGIPLTGDQTHVFNDLNLDIKYTNLEGYRINPKKIEQGTDFIAEVTIKNPGYKGHYLEMALTQIFPSGWEIHNARMDDNLGQKFKSDVPTYQDIRDDRVYTYFNLNSYKNKTFKIMLNASYLGKFYLPTIYCEAMYDNTINARRPGQWVEVVKGK